MDQSHSLHQMGFMLCYVMLFYFILFYFILFYLILFDLILLPTLHRSVLFILFMTFYLISLHVFIDKAARVLVICVLFLISVSIIVM